MCAESLVSQRRNSSAISDSEVSEESVRRQLLQATPKGVDLRWELSIKVRWQAY